MTTIRKIKGYGWRPDLPDSRDHLRLTAPVPLQTVDLRKTHKIPGMVDQGELGSCTGCAIADALAFNVLNKHSGGGESIPFSRLFIYYNERVLEGTEQFDAGAEIRSGIKSVSKQGICSERAWPYNIKAFAKKPTAAAYKQAANNPALKYERLNSSSKGALVSCLASGYPFVFGFTVYDSFENAWTAKTGEVAMPTPSNYVIGGHAVACYGYDMQTDRFIVKNSWSDSWGDGGWFYMPAAYMVNPSLSDDYWVITQIK